METVSVTRESMLVNAETKERRKMRLEHFFREAYALTFGLKPGEKRKLEDVTSDVIMVMRTTLSKKEFASALGMTEKDMFVTKVSWHAPFHLSYVLYVAWFSILFDSSTIL